MPMILIFCIVGSFAINNSLFGVIIMLVFGVFGWLMEENGFPVAPAILGFVLGAMLEENFVTSMIKSDGQRSPSSRGRSPARSACMTIALIVVRPLLRLLNRGQAAPPCLTDEATPTRGRRGEDRPSGDALPGN